MELPLFLLSLRTSQNHPAEKSRSLKTDPTYSQNFSFWDFVSRNECHSSRSHAISLPWFWQLQKTCPETCGMCTPGSVSSGSLGTPSRWWLTLTWRTDGCWQRRTASWAKDARLWRGHLFSCRRFHLRVESWGYSKHETYEDCRSALLALQGGPKQSALQHKWSLTLSAGCVACQEACLWRLKWLVEVEEYGWMNLFHETQEDIAPTTRKSARFLKSNGL